MTGLSRTTINDLLDMFRSEPLERFVIEAEQNTNLEGTPRKRPKIR